MIKKSIITKSITKEDQRSLDDATAKRTQIKNPEGQNMEAGEETADPDGDTPIARPELEPASSLDSHDDVIAAPDEHADVQEKDEVEPRSDMEPPSQSREPSMDAQPETEEVEEEIFISKELLQYVFRSQSGVPIPLIDERLECLHEAGKVLHEVPRSPIIRVTYVADFLALWWLYHRISPPRG